MSLLDSGSRKTRRTLAVSRAQWPERRRSGGYMSGKPRCPSNLTAPADGVYRTGSGRERVGALRPPADPFATAPGSVPAGLP